MIHRGGAEDAEGAQRICFSLRELCALCASAVSFKLPGNQL